MSPERAWRAEHDDILRFIVPTLVLEIEFERGGLRKSMHVTAPSQARARALARAIALVQSKIPGKVHLESRSAVCFVLKLICYILRWVCFLLRD